MLGAKEVACVEISHLGDRARLGWYLHSREGRHSGAGPQGNLVLSLPVFLKGKSCYMLLSRLIYTWGLSKPGSFRFYSHFSGFYQNVKMRLSEKKKTGPSQIYSRTLFRVGNSKGIFIIPSLLDLCICKVLLNKLTAIIRKSLF